MASPGDVYGFWNADAGENGRYKYHLCVCPSGKFLFLNSPKLPKTYAGDFHVPSLDVPLDPTPEGYSIISCTTLIEIPENKFKSLKPTYKGTISKAHLTRLVAFVETLDVLSQDEKDAILDGLADWL
jgi:hypothetical protein